MAKIFTVAQKLVVNGQPVYVHTDDTAFTSNAKLTTHKRQVGNGNHEVNYSYRNDTHPAPTGGKVYTIQQKLVTDAGTLYVSVLDYWWDTRKKATKAIKQLREDGGTNLVIYSFKVDMPQPREFVVEVVIGNITQTHTVTATSEDEANAIVSDRLAAAFDVDCDCDDDDDDDDDQW